MDNIVGTCSICGGAVSAPEVWHGIFPPQQTCQQCGAVAAFNGPVIPMIPSTPYKDKTTTGNNLDEHEGWTSTGDNSLGPAVFIEGSKK